MGIGGSGKKKKKKRNPAIAGSGWEKHGRVKSRVSGLDKRGEVGGVSGLKPRAIN